MEIYRFESEQNKEKEQLECHSRVEEARLEDIRVKIQAEQHHEVLRLE